MADKKTTTKTITRATDDSYEVRAFSEKYDLAPDEAALIIRRQGASRAKLDAYMATRR
jgi:hypothetical protein